MSMTEAACATASATVTSARPLAAGFAAPIRSSRSSRFSASASALRRSSAAISARWRSSAARAASASRGAALGQRAQPRGQLAGAREAARGVDVGGQRNVLAQQRVVDVALPARRERPPQVADDELEQHHAEREHVGGRAGLGAGQALGRDVVGRARSGVAGREREPQARDAQAVELRGVEQPRAAEVDEADRRAAVGPRREQHVGGLEVGVQHAGAVRGGQRIGDA
ncbi:MAG: hypothetical protein U1F07_17620 [Rubrivivax sp.]